MHSERDSAAHRGSIWTEPTPETVSCPAKIDILKELARLATERAWLGHFAAQQNAKYCRACGFYRPRRSAYGDLRHHIRGDPAVGRHQHSRSAPACSGR